MFHSKKINITYLARDVDAGEYIEKLLISAVVSTLTIRVFLHLTGYPQLGNGSFHIAHMLWGGFFMLLAILGLLIFLNKRIKEVASILGGIGFGMFIDELGKFITNDNNYFFQPTIAFIYVVFVLIFLASRAIERYFKLTPSEYTINALQLTQEAILLDLDADEKKRALQLLRKSDKNDPVVKLLRDFLNSVVALPTKEDNFLIKARNRINKTYSNIVSKPLFVNLVVVFFIFASAVGFARSAYNVNTSVLFADWGRLLSSTLSLVLVLWGTLLLKRGMRHSAFETFKFSLLVSIFLTQFFVFYKEQLSAIVGLAINVLVLNIIAFADSKQLTSYDTEIS